MPASRRSLRLTDAYRARLVALSDRVERQAREAWPRIEELDTTTWVDGMASLVTRAQVEGVRLTSAYLGAFLRAETGRGRTLAIDSRRYAGISRDGRPLAKALESPLIGVKAALKEGQPPSAALNVGLVRARRMVGFEVMQTPRDALLDTIEENERFDGFERSVAGTCAACMALSGEANMEVHPGCQCLPSPRVAGVVATIAIPTGAELFRSLSKEEQEATIGPEAAELVRDGRADLKDFVAHSRQEEQADFITQKPVEQVAT